MGVSFNNELLQALSAVDYWSLKQLAFLKCRIDFGSIDLKMFFDTLPQLQLLELSNCEIFNPMVKVDFPKSSNTSLLITQSAIKSTIRLGENWGKMVIQGPLDSVFQDCIIFFPTSTLTHLDLFKVSQTEAIMNLLSEILPHLFHLGLSGNNYMASSPDNAATAISRLASLKSFALLNNDNCCNLDLNDFLGHLMCKKGDSLKSLEIGYYFLNGPTKNEIISKCSDLEEFSWQVYGPFSRSRSSFLHCMRGLKALTLVDICPSECLSLRYALQELPELSDVTMASSCPENKAAFSDLAKDFPHISFKLILLTKHRAVTNDNEVRSMVFRNFLVTEDCPSYYKFQGIAYRCLH